MAKKQSVWTGALCVVTVSASLFAGSVSALANCRTGDCWGAVAYGANDAWAWSVNHPSRAAAESAAVSRCGGRCQRVLTFHNTCGAYASGPSGRGWASSDNKDAAIGRAMRECGGVSRNCTLRVWACTTR